MVTVIGVSIVAAIFTYGVSAALWNGEFTYHFGPTIRRRSQPVEYWLVVLLLLATMALMWTMALGQLFGFWTSR
jgi:hypothetical protein